MALLHRLGKTGIATERNLYSTESLTVKHFLGQVGDVLKLLFHHSKTYNCNSNGNPNLTSGSSLFPGNPWRYMCFVHSGLDSTEGASIAVACALFRMLRTAHATAFRRMGADLQLSVHRFRTGFCPSRSSLVAMVSARGGEKPGGQQSVREETGLYVGSASCSRCHGAIYQSYVKTAMGRSMTPAAPWHSPTLSVPAQFTNDKLDRRFDVFTRDGKLYESEYAVAADSSEVFRDTRPIAWLIGAGINGFGPVVEQDHYLVSGAVVVLYQAGHVGTFAGLRGN